MKFYSTAVIIFSLALVISHAAAPGTYDWSEHTISQLAAQGYDKAWIMRIGLAAFGLLLLSGSLINIIRDYRSNWAEFPLFICGLSFVLCGIFSTRPFEPDAVFSIQEARLHGAAGTTGRYALIISILAFALVEAPGRRKRLHFLTFCILLLIAPLLDILPGGVGVIQRALCITGLAWLAFADQRAVD